ncbi:hypothetical protein F5X96DRAFT_614722 [Biscogniauxia mediterranea]|nr:hypothetical protein F5X96DRAFT_614722 [Biscogniauxia mediterranea]
MARSLDNWRPGSTSKRSYSQYDTKDSNDNSKLQWETGEIAFLRNAYEFNAADHKALLATRYLHVNATCHPVIILAHSDDYGHYLVTTISAYGYNESNGFTPPWRQPCHQHKSVDGFRAFEGSERPNTKFPYLRLADGRSCPKVCASWVYIHTTFIVPASTLKIFDKSPHRLRMAPESLTDLLEHMKARSRMYQTESIDPRLQPSSRCDRDNSGAGNTAPKRARSIIRKSWRMPVNQTPAPCRPPTPPSSCSSSPDQDPSYSQILRGHTPQLATPPPTPAEPRSRTTTPASPEMKGIDDSWPRLGEEPKPLSASLTTKAPPAPSNKSKPLWSAIAAAATTTTPSTATAAPRKNQQQAQPKPQPEWRQQQNKNQKPKILARRDVKSWA